MYKIYRVDLSKNLLSAGIIYLKKNCFIEQIFIKNCFSKKNYVQVFASECVQWRIKSISAIRFEKCLIVFELNRF
jgi:hypothetical protein